MWRRSLTAVLIAWSIALPSAALAQQPEPRPVLLSASGGISKGAYQGGVDWTLSEFLRRHRVNEFRAKLYPGKDPDSIPGLELAAATGASAGNINALFAALAWCTDHLEDQTLTGVKGISAEASLFWKAWVNTGVAEMLSDHREKQRTSADDVEPAALDREFFFRVHLDSLDTFRRRAVPVSGCDLPVGLTLTRLEPVVVSLDGTGNGNGTAAVQRFATVFRIGTAADEKGAARLAFFEPATAHRNARSLGALAILPSLYAAPIVWDARRKAVFEAVLASSSFPIAFAPRHLQYLPGGLKPEHHAPGGDGAYFADGGVFDNNPIGLAAGLHELTLPQDQRGIRDVSANMRKPWIFYSSPDSRRGAAASSKPSMSVGVPTGIGAATQLLGNAIESARQYELQLFARQHARDEDDLRFAGAPELRQSSRALPIVGEMLGSFGAFLGRPFRERDFYLGIYDGLHFIARHVLCAGMTAVALDNCIAAQHQRLIADDVFQLSDRERKALSWFVQQEYGSVATLARATATDDHERLLAGINDHLVAQSRKAAPACGAGDPIARMLCRDRFGDLLDAMQRDTSIRQASALLYDEDCDDTLRKQGACIVDEAFEELLERPRRKLYTVVRTALDNLELAESQAQTAGRSGIVQMGQSIFRAATYRYRDSVEFMMSSGRSWDRNGKRGHVASVAGHLAPSYLQWNGISHREDSFVAGWRPLTWLVGDKVFFSSQLELSLRDLPAWKWGGGVSVGTFALPRVAAVEVGVTRLPRPVAERFMPPSTWDHDRPGRIAARLAIRAFADKIQVTMIGWEKAFSFGVGVNDLNGMLFWWIR